MENKINNKSVVEISTTNKINVFQLSKNILIILLVIGAGVFTVNQVLEYRYKSVFLQAPCAVCAKLNPNVTECFTKTIKVFPNGLNWKDPNTNKCYDSNSQEVKCVGENITNKDLNISDFIIPS